MPPVETLLLHCRTGSASSVPWASLEFQPLLLALSFASHSPVGNCEVAPGASFLERWLRDGGHWEGILSLSRQTVSGRQWCPQALLGERGYVCMHWGFLLVLFLSWSIAAVQYYISYFTLYYMLHYTSNNGLVLMVKNPPANAGHARDTGSIPGSGRSPGGGRGNPLQCSCLENPMDRGDGRATGHWVAKNGTWLSNCARTRKASHNCMSIFIQFKTLLIWFLFLWTWVIFLFVVSVFCSCFNFLFYVGA